MTCCYNGDNNVFMYTGIKLFPHSSSPPVRK